MADTIRSLSELNTLLGDNSSGGISAQDIRDMMISQMCHAEIGSLGQAQEVLGAGWVALKLDTDGAFKRGFTTDLVNYKITATPVDMKVEIGCEILFLGDDGVDVEFSVFKGVAQQARFDITLVGKGSTVVGASWGAGLQLDASDDLSFGIRSNGNSFTLVRGRLSVRRIGVE